MRVVFKVKEIVDDEEVFKPVEFSVKNNQVIGFEPSFSGVRELTSILIAKNDAGKVNDVIFVHERHYKTTFRELMHMAKAIVDKEDNLPEMVSICENLVSDLKGKKFIFVKYQDGTQIISAIFDDNIHKVTLFGPKFRMFDLDLYLLKYSSGHYAVMQPDKDVQGNSEVVVIKTEAPADGLHNLRKDSYMRNLCQIIRNELIATIDIPIEIWFRTQKVWMNEIRLGFGRLARIKISESEENIYEQMRHFCSNRDHIQLWEIEQIAQKTNSKKLKGFVTRVHSLGFRFGLTYFDIDGTKYVAVNSHLDGTDRTITIRPNVCFVTPKQDVEEIARLLNILKCLNEFKDPNNVIVYYPTGNSISKMPILEFLNNSSIENHVLYIDSTNGMYAYSRDRSSFKKHGKCKVYEINNAVMVFTTDGILMYTPKELKFSNIIDKNDYECFALNN